MDLRSRKGLALKKKQVAHDDVLSKHAWATKACITRP
jgi:hypothetical protein